MISQGGIRGLLHAGGAKEAALSAPLGASAAHMTVSLNLLPIGLG